MTAMGRLLADFSHRRRPLRSLGASGQLGYGIPTPALESGLARDPDMIGVDMGSIDIGPALYGRLVVKGIHMIFFRCILLFDPRREHSSVPTASPTAVARRGGQGRRSRAPPKACP